MQRQHVQDKSPHTNPTRSAVLPADADERAITSPETVEKDLHSHAALKHAWPGFGWHRVNFPPSSCHVLDVVQEEC